MPSTYTLNNGIELISTGEQSGTWGDTTNTNFDLVDTALDGQVSILLSGAGSSGSPNNLPISDGASSNGRNRMITFTDGTDLGATAFVQLTPNDSEKIIYVRNNLRGSRSIILFQGTYNASNDYEVPAGTTAVVYFDGAGTGAVAANVFNNAYFDSLRLGGVSVDKILDEDNMASDDAAALATQQSIKAYVDSQVTAQDLDFAGGTGTGAVDLDSQTFTVAGTANEIETSASGQTVTVGLADTVAVGTSLNIAGDGATVTGIKDEDDMASNSATKLATQQSIKAYVDSQVTAQDLDFTGDTGNGSVDLDSQAFSISGTANEIETSASGQTITVGLPSSVTVASLTATTADINGGTIDGTVIGGAAPAAGSFTGLTSSAGITVATVSGYANIEVGGPSGGFIDLKAPASDDYDARIMYDITAANLTLTTQSASEPVVLAQGGATKLSTTSTGVDVTGTVTMDGGSTSADFTFGDNDKAIFGAGSDLQIYHDGSNSVIADTGSGALITYCSNFIIQQNGSDERMADFAQNGAVRLNFDGQERLSTTSTGVAVTGTVKSTVSTTGVNSFQAVSTGGGNFRIYPDDATTANPTWKYQSNSSEEQAWVIGGAERMRLDSSGKLRVGSANPPTAGAISAVGSSGGVALALSDNVNSSLYVRNASGGSILGTDSGGNLRFATNGNTASSEAMRINSSGKVLVNRTTAYSDGTIGNAAFQVNANTGAFAGLAVIATATTGTAAIGFVNPNGSVGNISLSGTSTSYGTSSDYRLKTDAQPMTGASARVQALNPVNFEWIVDGTRVDGFLAHEAQEVVPEAVTGTKDAMGDEEYEVTPAVLDDDGNVVTEAVMGTRSAPVYQGIDQSKLVPLLTAALQEALTRIDALETRLTALGG